MNATVILEGYRKKPGEVATDTGNPIAEFRYDKADGFATWGGPHILSLVTEVATRALRAVRRQKFLIHRRARPEVLAARLTQVHNRQKGRMDPAAITKIESMLRELGADDPADENRPGVLLHWISALNAERNGGAATAIAGKKITGGNFLLPMAFPEGSPMHAAYGAGHATVAGACVTMMKAFYDKDLTMKQVHGFTKFYQTDANGDMKEAATMDAGVLVSHELDKLAANISIGRNHAGVHFYTDYYDSLRLGERVAVGILEEQMLAYNEEVTLSFTGFDGEEIALKTDGSGTAAGVTMTVDGAADANWWTRNVQDFQLAPDPALLA
ncbi:hypothetical protein GYB14_06740 [bacterium]|nr:hypothetical protein [bacterium]